MPAKNLPPLGVGQAYRAADFAYFEYVGSKLTGSKAILRLHLKNGTTVDLPASDDEFRRLQIVLNAAFPDNIAKRRSFRLVAHRPHQNAQSPAHWPGCFVYRSLAIRPREGPCRPHFASVALRKGPRGQFQILSPPEPRQIAEGG
jgi:hypothetical protein